jgi:hypothetical protein
MPAPTLFLPSCQNCKPQLPNGWRLQFMLFAKKSDCQTQMHNRWTCSKVTFSFPFYLKNFRFWFIILQNETKHHTIFFAKGIHSLFWIKKSQKNQKALIHPMKNLVF